MKRGEQYKITNKWTTQFKVGDIVTVVDSEPYSSEHEEYLCILSSEYEKNTKYRRSSGGRLWWVRRENAEPVISHYSIF